MNKKYISALIFAVVLIIVVGVTYFLNSKFHFLADNLANNFPYEIFPTPKEINATTGGKFVLNSSTKLIAADTEEPFAISLRGYLAEKFNFSTTVNYAVPSGNYIRIVRNGQLGSAIQGEYKIEIDSNKAIITGHDDEGIRNGMQTFYQLFRQQGASLNLPVVSVSDYPSNQTRMAFINAEDPRSSTQAEKLALIKMLSALKYNKLLVQDSRYITSAYSYKVEGTDTWTTGRLTNMQMDQFWAEQRELFAFARQNNLEPIPLVEGFGHAAAWSWELGSDIYVSGVNTNDRYLASATEPGAKVYNHWVSIAQKLKEELDPTVIHIGHDEVRGIGNSQSEIDYGMSKNNGVRMTTAELFALEIQNVNQAISVHLPDAKLMIWSDMFDPNYNGGADLYHDSWNTADAAKILSQKGLSKKMIVTYWGIVKFLVPEKTDTNNTCACVKNNSEFKYYNSTTYKCNAGTWEMLNPAPPVLSPMVLDNTGDNKIPIVMQTFSGFTRTQNIRVGYCASSDSCAVGDGWALNPPEKRCDKQPTDPILENSIPIANDTAKYLTDLGFEIVLSRDTNYPFDKVFSANSGISGLSFTSWNTGDKPESVRFFDEQMSQLSLFADIGWSDTTRLTVDDGEKFINNAKAQLIDQKEKYLALPEAFGYTGASFVSSFNISEKQVITKNPYMLSVKVADPSKVSKVEYYIDNILVGTATLPDVNGVYDQAWDTSKYHSIVKIIVYGTDGQTEELTRNTTVDLSGGQEANNPIVAVLPKTGENSTVVKLIDFLRSVIRKTETAI